MSAPINKKDSCGAWPRPIIPHDAQDNRQRHAVHKTQHEFVVALASLALVAAQRGGSDGVVNHESHLEPQEDAPAVAKARG